MKNSSPEILDVAIAVAIFAIIFGVIYVIWGFVWRIIFIIVHIGRHDPFGLLCLLLLIVVPIQVVRAILLARKERRQKSR